MDKPSIPPSDFNLQEFLADSFSDQNLAVRKEFLVQGAQDVRRVASTVLEWYQNLEPGRFALWYHALESRELWQWYYTLSEWSKTPR